MNQTHDVFISYRTTDRSLAEPMRDGLVKKKLTAWIDHRDILAGKHWRRELRDALRRCRFLVAVVTPAYIESAWTLMEAESVEARQSALAPTRVIPCLFEGRAAPFLSHLQHVDMLPHRRRQGFRDLVRLLRRYKKQQTTRTIGAAAGAAGGLFSIAKWIHGRISEHTRQDVRREDALRDVVQYASHQRLAEILREEGIAVPTTKAERARILTEEIAVDADLLSELLTVDELRQLNRDLGLTARGSKRELIARVLDAIG